MILKLFGVLILQILSSNSNIVVCEFQKNFEIGETIKFKSNKRKQHHSFILKLLLKKSIQVT